MILDIVCQKSSDMELKKRFCELLNESGSLQYTREFLIKLHSAITVKIDELGGNPKMQNTVDNDLQEVLNTKLYFD